MRELELTFEREKIKNMSYSLFALYIIYSTDSLIASINADRFFEYCSYAVLGVLAIIFFIKLLIRNHGCVTFEFMTCVICVLLSSIMNFDNSFIGVIKACSLIIGFYIARELDTRRFIKSFVSMMTFIACTSMVIYFFKDFLVGLNILPVISGYKEQQFANFLFSNVRIYPVSSVRNWGPFWEPGAYQAYIIVSLLFLMFDDIEFKYKNFMLIIHVITIGTIMSTTGFLAAPFLLIAFFLSQKASNKALLTKIIITLITFGFALWFISSQYFDVIFTNKFDIGSDIDRIVTVRYGIELFLQKPIFGYSSVYTDKFHEIAGQTFSISNTYIANFVVFGLVVGVLSIVLIYRFVKSFKNSDIVTFLIFVSLIISFSGEKMLYSPIFSFMMFYRSNKMITRLGNPISKK